MYPDPDHQMTILEGGQSKQFQLIDSSMVDVKVKEVLAKGICLKDLTAESSNKIANIFAKVPKINGDKITLSLDEGEYEVLKQAGLQENSTFGGKSVKLTVNKNEIIFNKNDFDSLSKKEGTSGISSKGPQKNKGILNPKEKMVNGSNVLGMQEYTKVPRPVVYKASKLGKVFSASGVKSDSVFIQRDLLGGFPKTFYKKADGDLQDLTKNLKDLKPTEVLKVQERFLYKGLDQVVVDVTEAIKSKDGIVNVNLNRQNLVFYHKYGQVKDLTGQLTEGNSINDVTVREAVTRGDVKVPAKKVILYKNSQGSVEDLTLPINTTQAYIGSSSLHTVGTSDGDLVLYKSSNPDKSVENLTQIVREAKLNSLFDLDLPGKKIYLYKHSDASVRDLTKEVSHLNNGEASGLSVQGLDQPLRLYKKHDGSVQDLTEDLAKANPGVVTIRTEDKTLVFFKDLDGKKIQDVTEEVKNMPNESDLEVTNGSLYKHKDGRIEFLERL